MSITLEMLLKAREERYKRQRAYLDEYKSTLVTLTLNIPGDIKQTDLYQKVHEEGIKAIQEALADAIIEFDYKHLETGSEAYFVTSIEPEVAKKKLMDIEESHPLGRIFDMDVFRPDGTSISRTIFGQSKRICIICGDNVTVCRRLNKHSVHSVVERIENMANAFF